MSRKGNFIALLDAFFRPDKEFRPATMWFWNDELHEEEITFQLEKFKEQGIYDFFVNHVWCATDEYLSARYFEAVRHAVAEAKRLELSFWIYDEFNWPSGIAGGQLLRDRPETRAKLLRATVKGLNTGGALQDIHIDGKFECAQIRFDRPDKRGSRCEDVTDRVTVTDQTANGFYMTYRNDTLADVELYIFSSGLQKSVLAASMWGKYSWGQEGYVDALDHAAIRAFIHSTHVRYREEVGNEFGKTVKGLFTDEVCVGSPFDLGLGRIPWNDNMARTFENRFGYDLRPWFYTLFCTPETPEEKRVRYHFWRLMTELVRDCHIKQAYEWCGEHNLLYTGHFDGEEYLRWMMYQSGDIFELMQYMHIPGIDSILSRDRIDDEEFNIAGKILGSCSRFYNRPRTLCETYTGSSWKLRFNEMRRIANRLIVLGANMIQYMGSYYSMDNPRKVLPICYPPSHNYNNSMFARYGDFGDYIARLQQLSYLTEPCGRVLVMLPQAGCYVNFDGNGPIFADRKLMYDIESGRYETSLMTTVNALLELNVEYDIFGDCMANKVVAEGGEAELYGGKYDTVVLLRPDDTTSGVISMLSRLEEAGVRLIFVDALPSLAVDTAEPVSPYGSTPESYGITGISGNIYLLRCPYEERFRGSNTHFKEMLLELLGREKVVLDIRHNNTVYTSLRRCNDATLVFIANDEFEPQPVSFAYHKGMQILDPSTGKRLPPTIEHGRVKYCMEPCQMLAVLIPGDGAVAENWFVAPATRYTRRTNLDFACSIIPVRGNMLRAAWGYVPDATGPNVCDRDILPMDGLTLPSTCAQLSANGAVIWDLPVEYLPQSVDMFVETSGVQAVYINGAEARLTPCRFWGVHNAKCEVSPLLRTGQNRIVVVFQTADYYAPYLVPFLFLTGRFETDGVSMFKPHEFHTASPVNRQGFPHLAGEAVYRFTKMLSPSDAVSGSALSLSSLDAAAVSVNGKTAGERLWAPFDFDVSGLLKEGENVFEITLTLPMANLMNDPIDCGLTGIPVLRFQ